MAIQAHGLSSPPKAPIKQAPEHIHFPGGCTSAGAAQCRCPLPMSVPVACYSPIQYYNPPCKSQPACMHTVQDTYGYSPVVTSSVSAQMPASARASQRDAALHEEVLSSLPCAAVLCVVLPSSAGPATVVGSTVRWCYVMLQHSFPAVLCPPVPLCLALPGHFLALSGTSSQSLVSPTQLPVARSTIPDQDPGPCRAAMPSKA